MDFTLRCSVAMLDVSSDFMRTIPPERLTDSIKTDADEVRQGVVQNLSGALRLVREGYLRAAAIARLAGTLRENAERLARNLPEGERRDLAVLARSLVAKAGPSSADLEAFAKAMDAP
ncbi:MAG: hypothetical protein Q8S29_08725, partial [Phreatobacter sp.]|nr:hypothetical protein [Phreatobacter sp.]